MRFSPRRLSVFNQEPRVRRSAPIAANRYFARNELSRLRLGVLRTAAGELMSTDDIAGRVIAAKRQPVDFVGGKFNGEFLWFILVRHGEISNIIRDFHNGYYHFCSGNETVLADKVRTSSFNCCAVSASRSSSSGFW